MRSLSRICIEESHVPPSPADSSSRTGLALVAGAALACTLFASPIHPADEAKPPPKTPQRERLTIAPEEMMAPWTGDLDGMIARRVIRVLTVYSKTFYFMDKGSARRPTYLSAVQGGSKGKLAKKGSSKSTSRCGWCSFCPSRRLAAGAGRER